MISRKRRQELACWTIGYLTICGSSMLYFDTTPASTQCLLLHPMALATPIPKRTSIILAGHWNRMIFTPEWVGQYVFKAEEMAVSVPLLPIDPIRYESGPIRLEVSFPKVAIFATAVDPHHLAVMELAAHTILARLDDTPLKGIGVNFGFDVVEKSETVDAVLQLKESALLDEYRGTRVIRRLKKEDGRVVHVTLSNWDDIQTIDFNYHWEPVAGVRALEMLDGQIRPLFDDAKGLLASAYSLTLGSS